MDSAQYTLPDGSQSSSRTSAPCVADWIIVEHKASRRYLVRVGAIAYLAHIYGSSFVRPHFFFFFFSHKSEKISFFFAVTVAHKHKAIFLSGVCYLVACF